MPKTSNLNPRKLPDQNTKFVRNREIEAHVNTTTGMQSAKLRSWETLQEKMTLSSPNKWREQKREGNLKLKDLRDLSTKCSV